MKSSALLKALLLSAVLVGLIEAAPFQGGCGCASPCGCGGAKFSVATVPIQLSLPAPAPAPSCGCGSICGGSCGIPAPSCGCGSPCGGSCGIPAPSCGLPALHHHGKCGCGPRFVEVTKCRKFLVPAPRPRCHKCLVPACICDAPAPAPVCGCHQPCGC